MTIVTRRDLSPGYQAVQAAHSIPEFHREHPQEYQKWYEESKTLVLLSVKDEDYLKYFIRQLHEKGVKYSIFLEPDIGNQVTSVAFVADDEAYQLCKKLPLVLREFSKPQK